MRHRPIIAMLLAIGLTTGAGPAANRQLKSPRRWRYHSP
jgi:hypothetical protein